MKDPCEDNPTEGASHCPCYWNQKGGWVCCCCDKQNSGVRRSKVMVTKVLEELARA